MRTIYMFNFDRYKHEGEICLSIHIGYQIPYKTLAVILSVYKYSFTIEWSRNV
jgi:hypothetical protein